MKTEMIVVSSVKTAANYNRIRNFTIKNNTTTSASMKPSPTPTSTMDQAFVNLKVSLRELRDQDREIYEQLMAIDVNIKRIKEEIHTEQIKREKIDRLYEDEESTCESESDLETQDVNEIEAETGDNENDFDSLTSPVATTTTTTTNTKSSYRTTIHERLDSGIMEDDNYEDETDSSPFSTFTDDKDNENNLNQQSVYSNIKIKRNIFSPIRGMFARSVSSENKLQMRDEVNENNQLQRSRTLQCGRSQFSTKRNRFYQHRRSASEDQIRIKRNVFLNLKSGIDNAAFRAPIELDGKNNENSNPNITSTNARIKLWTLDDVEEHANSSPRKLYRYRIAKDNNLHVINSLSLQSKSMVTEGKILNSSLTQLNLQGAISNGTIKAIQRSTSIGNCSAVGQTEIRKISGDKLNRSLDLRRSNESRSKMIQRSSSSTGFNDSMVGFQVHNLDLRKTSKTWQLDGIASMISLV